MEKRRFQDLINIECQRQMRLSFLMSQAAIKLQKVKDKSQVGKTEVESLKKLTELTHSVTSYLDKEVALLKEYAKMDLSRFEPLDSTERFSKILCISLFMSCIFIGKLTFVSKVFMPQRRVDIKNKT